MTVGSVVRTNLMFTDEMILELVWRELAKQKDNLVVFDEVTIHDVRRVGKEVHVVVNGIRLKTSEDKEKVPEKKSFWSKIFG